MAILDDLARRFAETHSTEATATLESMTPAEAAAFLADLPAPVAAEIISQASLPLAVPATTILDPGHAAAIYGQMSLAVAAATLRRLEDGARERILERMEDALRDALERLLRFPPRTGGSLLDPRVLALPETLSAEDAIDRIQETPQFLLYNLYVVNRAQVLVGVLNIRELLVAERHRTLRELMKPASHAASVTDSAATIVSHPGWRDTHSLPVLDDDGVFLGAIRYSTLRKLESQLARAGKDPASTTVRALGDLFWTGVGGLITAAATTVTARSDEER
jgi:magnesium transporter